MKAHDLYNASVIERMDLNPTLMIIRVKPDGALFAFEPGQYGVLGLSCETPRVKFSDPDEEATDPNKLIRRAYSISSSSRENEYVEFYISLVRSGALTPRLFSLKPGDRIWLGPKATGHFLLSAVNPKHDLLMISTGTGLAPYLSMVRSAHQCGQGPVFVVIHGARYSWDLGYRSELQALDHGCRNFVYIPTITRVEQDPHWTGHVGRVHTVIEDGTFEERLGRAPDPDTLSIFLCGNPDMVQDLQKRFERMGFTMHSKKQPGNIHIERYW